MKLRRCAGAVVVEPVLYLERRYPGRPCHLRQNRKLRLEKTAADTQDYHLGLYTPEQRKSRVHRTQRAIYCIVDAHLKRTAQKLRVRDTTESCKGKVKRFIKLLPPLCKKGFCFLAPCRFARDV